MSKIQSMVSSQGRPHCLRNDCSPYAQLQPHGQGDSLVYDAKSSGPAALPQEKELHGNTMYYRKQGGAHWRVWRSSLRQRVKEGSRRREGRHCRRASRARLLSDSLR